VFTREDYTGHELDVETGMHYAGARYYMGALGRWTNTDPILREQSPRKLLKDGKVQAFSTSAYNYSFNNPANLRDQTGKWPTPWDLLDFAAAGLSIRDAWNNPSAANIGWAAADVAAAALPIIPSTGIFRHGRRLLQGSAAAMEMVQGADKLAGAGRAVSRIGSGADLGQDVNAAFRSIDNNLRDHLTDMDLSGAFKELAGIEIVDRNGNPVNHIEEVGNALSGLKSSMDDLKKALGNDNLSDEARQTIQSKLSETSKLTDQIEGFLNKAEELRQ
jgi:RHS repeat-associated protein